MDLVLWSGFWVLFCFVLCVYLCAGDEIQGLANTRQIGAYWWGNSSRLVKEFTLETIVERKYWYISRRAVSVGQWVGQGGLQFERVHAGVVR